MSDPVDTTDLDAPVTEPAPADGYGPVEGQPGGFNATWYAHANPDVVAAGVDPLWHYQTTGKAEGRQPYEGGTGTPSAAVIAAIAAARAVTAPPASPALTVPSLPNGAVAAITIYGDAARKVHFMSRGFTLPQIAEVLGIVARDIGAKVVPAPAPAAQA